VQDPTIQCGDCDEVFRVPELSLTGDLPNVQYKLEHHIRGCKNKWGAHRRLVGKALDKYFDAQIRNLPLKSEVQAEVSHIIKDAKKTAHSQFITHFGY